MRVVLEEIEKLNGEISLLDAGILFRLAMNMQLATGSLLVSKVSKGGTPQPLTMKDMEKVLGKKEDGVKTALKRLEAIGAIRKEKKGRNNVYFINELLINIGKQQAATPFAKVYKTESKKMLEKLTDSQAGLLLKLIPYVNYHYLILTHDPTEKDETKAKPLRMNEVAALLGMTENRFNILFSKLKAKQAVATYETGTKGKAIYIHPHLVDRGNTTEALELHIIKLFRLMQN
ncbi:BlaI/MecI/CopY family transcriptional regulator [Bacillus coahuilensis]|uniref:BlaI/MecI/CopY family transcriptional regulator n=1 Tax=Bacillus coahuilensis TaxID=408580 RepID=UPI0007501779|nr:BlaI/MecI/CopY family transcriptional regulator [Bacillus coahuilensis]